MNTRQEKLVLYVDSQKLLAFRGTAFCFIDIETGVTFLPEPEKCSGIDIYSMFGTREKLQNVCYCIKHIKTVHKNLQIVNKLNQICCRLQSKRHFRVKIKWWDFHVYS